MTELYTPNEVHRAYRREFEHHFGRIKHESGHFTESYSWLAGTPVEWFIDDVRGEEWPQVVLPDGHILTFHESDVVVITERRYRQLVAELDTFKSA